MAVFFSEKCKRLHTYVKRPFIPDQTFKLSNTASDSKDFKRPKFFRRSQIFSRNFWTQSGPSPIL